MPSDMSSTSLRQTILTQARQVVVKVGSQLLTGRSSSGLDVSFINTLAFQVAELMQQGYQITLVCSGAIAAGCAELGLSRRPTDLADQQAVAAVGQRRLMACMHEAFDRHKLPVGQVLLTRGDFDDRVRFLNIRNCINRLHGLGCVPVINENDSVAVEEIEALRVGENDVLAAMICNALRSDALVLLTVVDGLLDESNEVIDLIDNVSDYINLSRQDQSQWGSGGMRTKLEAARLVTEAGEIAVIAPGRVKNILARILCGEKVGSVFVPRDRKLDSRKRWIALTARPAGTVAIDDGAVKALTKQRKSLLASGVTAITGRFNRGDIVLVRDPAGKELARGLTNYGADELRLIMGKRSSQFLKILGRPSYDEVIPRDNLVVLLSTSQL